MEMDMSELFDGVELNISQDGLQKLMKKILNGYKRWNTNCAIADIVITIGYIGWGLFRLYASGMALGEIVTTSAVITAVIGGHVSTLAATLGAVIAGEALTVVQLAGFALALAAMVAGQLNPRQSRPGRELR